MALSDMAWFTVGPVTMQNLATRLSHFDRFLLDFLFRNATQIFSSTDQVL
jgi:hypothetical protein